MSNRTKLTESQIKEIEQSKLTYLELTKIYKISTGTVCKIKKEAGTNKGQGANIVNYRQRIKADELLEILNPDNKVEYLAKKYNITQPYVSRLRKKHGMQRINVIKREPKEIKPLTQQRVKPLKKSKFEEDNIIKEKAIKAKLNYQELESKQKEQGFRFITRIGKYGIKETVWTNK